MCSVMMTKTISYAFYFQANTVRQVLSCLRDLFVSQISYIVDLSDIKYSGHIVAYFNYYFLFMDVRYFNLHLHFTFVNSDGAICISSPINV